MQQQPVKAMHLLMLGKLYAKAKRRKYFTWKQQQAVITEYCLTAKFLN